MITFPYIEKRSSEKHSSKIRDVFRGISVNQQYIYGFLSAVDLPIVGWSILYDAHAYYVVKTSTLEKCTEIIVNYRNNHY